MRRWPERFDSSRPLDTWREFRAPFASSVTGEQWAEVDSVYGGLHQLALGAELGQASFEIAKPLVQSLLEKVRKAKRIVADHAADSQKERGEIESVLEAP
jgi:hypothetical protein